MDVNEPLWKYLERVARLTFSLQLSGFKEFSSISIAEMDLIMDLSAGAYKFCAESPAPIQSTKFHEVPQRSCRQMARRLVYEG